MKPSSSFLFIKKRDDIKRESILKVPKKPSKEALVTGERDVGDNVMLMIL